MQAIACPKCQYGFAVNYRDQKVSRKPVLLKCSHTFCESCVSKLAKEGKNDITCPTCENVTHVPKGTGVKALPNNYYLTGYILNHQNTMLQEKLSKTMPSGMVPVMKKTEASVATRGMLCSECCINKATCKCIKCDCVMCGFCFDKVHSLSNTLKQHQAVGISEDETVSSEAGLISPTCRLHKKPIEYFCEDDSMAICSRCVIIGDHKDHSIISMEEKNKTIVGDLEPALQFAMQVLKKLGKGEKTLSGSVPPAKTETVGAIDSIKSHFLELHAALQAREADIIDEVYKVYESGVAELVNARSEMLEEKQRLKDVIRAAHRVVNNSDEVVLNASDVLDKLERAKNILCVVSKVESKPEAGIQFECDSSLLHAVKSYGSIVGDLPKRVELYKLGDSPDNDTSDDAETASVVSVSSLTSGTDVTSTANTEDDVIIEEEEDIISESGDASKPKFVLKPVPGRAKLKGHYENVLVTHIKDPHKFFVKRCSLEYNYQKMSKAINTWCKGLATEEDIPRELHKHDFVLCEYHEDKQWYRAKVSSVMTTRETNQEKTVTKTHVEVRFIDFGNHHTITKDKTRNMETRFMKYPEFLLECSLHDIEPTSNDGMWPVEAGHTLQKMIADKAMFMTVISDVGNVLQVDLRKPASDAIEDDRPMSVRDCLVFLELANFATSPEKKLRNYSELTGNQHRRDYMKPEPRGLGEIFVAVITSCGSPSSFCAQPSGEEASYLDNLMADMQSVYSETTNLYTVYCPQVDMICAVHSVAFGKWYRGRVIDLPGKKEVDVQFVDYGTIERVSYQRINKILDKHIKLPPLAVQCELIDVEPTEVDTSWGIDCLEWWTDLTSDQIFQIKVLEVQVDAVQVILHHVEEDVVDQLSINYQLVAKGFAKSTGVGSTVLGPQKKSLVDPKKTYSVRPTRASKVQESAEVAHSYLTGSQGTDRNLSSTGDKPAPPNSENPVTGQRKLKLDVEVAGQNVSSNTSPGKGKEEPESPSVNVEVVISTYVSPADFHIQVTSNLPKLHAMSSQLRTQFNGSEPSQKAWKVRDICAVRHKGKWYRGSIAEILEDNVIRVSLLDYGFVETVHRDELRIPDIKIMCESCYAIRCHLANVVSAGSVDPKVWSATASEFMLKQIDGKTLYIKREDEYDGESLPVDLLIEEVTCATALEPSHTVVYSLISKMKEEGLAMPVRNKSSTQKVDSSLQEPQPEEEGEFVECVVQHYEPRTVSEDAVRVLPMYVDYNGIMYCQPFEVHSEFQYMSEVLEQYKVSQPQKVKWERNQACVAFFKDDHTWYRARVLDMIDQNKVAIQYLDFGNSEILPANKLKLPDEKLVAIPQLCLECVLYKIQPVSENGKWPTHVLNIIHEIIVNHCCGLKVMKTEAGSPVEGQLTLPDGSDLGQTLVQMDLATQLDELTLEYDHHQKVSDIMEMGFPFKKPILASPGVMFPVIVTHMELPNVAWFQHKYQEPQQVDEDMEKVVMQINSDLVDLLNVSGELAQMETIGKTFVKVPLPGQMCCAKFSFDDCWYRGLVVDRNEANQVALVLFVDYGNVDYVHLDRLRVLPASFRGLAAQGVRCTLAGLQPPGGSTDTWSKECMTQFFDLMPNKSLLARITVGDPLTVELFEEKFVNGEGQLFLAYEMLIEQGLARLDSNIVLLEQEPSTMIKDFAQADVILEDKSEHEITDEGRVTE